MARTIKEIGGEFALINQIVRPTDTSSVLVTGPGDDGAVVTLPSGRLVVSTDSLVEDFHFSTRYACPRDIGFKALEASASDIVAMGCAPKFALIALAIGPKWQVEEVTELYDGVYESAERLGLTLIGGDTVSSSVGLTMTVTVFGEIEPEQSPVLRSGARPGDALWVTGFLGESAAGLELLQKNLQFGDLVKSKHLRPYCRRDVGVTLSRIATSMIDISDGLSGDLGHIVTASKCGAVLKSEALRVSPALQEVCSFLNCDPLEYVLHGGEDYELLYTVPTDLEDEACGYRIGEITGGSGVMIETNGSLKELSPRSWNHFQ